MCGGSGGEGDHSRNVSALIEHHEHRHHMCHRQRFWPNKKEREKKTEEKNMPLANAELQIYTNIVQHPVAIHTNVVGISVFNG